MKLVLIYTISFVIITRAVAQEKFCGGKINQVLSRFCIVHNAPDQRIKRQVVTECCYNKCSVKYLVINYCDIYDSEALENHLQELRMKEIETKDNIEKINGVTNYVLENRKRRKASRCYCKNKSKRKRLHNKQKFVLRKTWEVPRSKMGVIEDDQTPIYIVNRF